MNNTNKKFILLRDYLIANNGIVKSEYNTFINGSINGYIFRIFSDRLICGKYQTAYVAIKDENAKGSMWPAFYRIPELKEWLIKHPARSNTI